jgi:hypothetical protein
VVVDLPSGAEGERRQKWHGGFQTKKAAEAVRARLVHELTTGFYVESSRMLLSEWLVDHWLPVHKTRVKKTTYRAYRSAIFHHVNPRPGGVTIGKLTAQMLNGLYQHLLADGRSMVMAGWHRRRSPTSTSCCARRWPMPKTPG